MLHTVGTLALWAGFTAFVAVLLLLDLFAFNRKAHRVGFREALGWSCFWVTLALLFNGWVLHRFGAIKALEFFTGYLIELSLSVDNLFVFLLVFTTFGVEPKYQHRVLFWGIVGAQVMRLGFILAGAALLDAFHWLFYVFGVFLVYTGVKILLGRGTEVHPEKNPVLFLFRKIVRTASGDHGGRFLVRKEGRLFATDLLPVLAVVEATDLVFAVDSIPAVFAVTRDPFIVYTSNVFAILGLRAIYFLLAQAMDRFHYLKVGLGLVLAFVGVKMTIADWFHVPITVSLGVVAALLLLSVVASLLRPARPCRAASPAEAPGAKIEPAAEGDTLPAEKKRPGEAAH